MIRKINNLRLLTAAVCCGLLLGLSTSAWASYLWNACNNTVAKTPCPNGKTVQLGIFGTCVYTGGGAFHKCDAFGFSCGASGSCECWAAGWLLNAPEGCP
jgi:hypothetical protein